MRIWFDMPVEEDVMRERDGERERELLLKISLWNDEIEKSDMENITNLSSFLLLLFNSV